MKIAVLCSGRGTNLNALIEGAGRYQVELVISNRPDAGGLEIARKHKVPSRCINHKTFPSREAFEKVLLAELANFDIELIVLAGFMRILTNTFIDCWLGRMINIHPSLLPKYPGLHPHRRALAAKDKHHGTTLHYVIPELDAGPAITQLSLPILPNESEHSLIQRILVIEHRAVVQVVNAIVGGKISFNAGVAYCEGEPLPPTGLSSQALGKVTPT